jgi:DNA-directed RNA polymerase beta' subunit
MPKISFRDIDNMDCSCHGKMSGSGLGKLPSNIERLMEKNKDNVISKIIIFRLPLADALVKALNLLTNDSVKKFLKRDEKHDELFHLGMFIETTNGDMFVYDKAQNFNFQVAKKSFLKQKDIELSPVSDIPDGLTIGGLFDAGRKKMGSKYYTYDALKNNCQRFVAENLDSIGASYDKEFVVQNLEKLAKRIPAFQKKFGVLLTDFAREADKVKSIAIDTAKNIRREVKDTAKDVKKGVKKGAKKAVKKTKNVFGFGWGYEVAMV